MWKSTKRYSTGLTVEEIQSLIGKKVKERLLLQSRYHSARIQEKHFSFQSAGGMKGFPVKIVAELNEGENSRTMNLTINPVYNPLFFITPFLLISLAVFFPEVEINGKPTTISARVLFSLGSIVSAGFFAALALSPVVTERKLLEKELRLEPAT